LGDGSIGPEQVAVARKAVEGCPEGAISITD
jgi:ferredoxin